MSVLAGRVRGAGGDRPGRLRQDHHPGRRRRRGPAGGRPVLAVSTTNQAVGQLRQVGIPAVTVARFALDRSPLAAGSVVIVDEFSQLATGDAEVVLASAAACPGGRCGGRRSPPGPTSRRRRSGRLARPNSPTRAGPGSGADRTAARPTRPNARRSPASGPATSKTSQGMRDRAGWEHHHATATKPWRPWPPP